MAVILVTYDLKAPGRNYEPVWAYLRSFTHCKGLESVWLLDTTFSTEAIRDRLNNLVDANDRTFAVRITRDWASYNMPCADWLNSPSRTW